MLYIDFFHCYSFFFENAILLNNTTETFDDLKLGLNQFKGLKKKNERCKILLFAREITVSSFYNISDFRIDEARTHSSTCHTIVMATIRS